ncbi:hypothetical protein MPH_03357 [Macrophomina phaseolina MS6]|uniref:Uncharacterized protein n=1 Tax=Macrophomina phaseolina (strain MS6) TaxID=1126212 RepID=K2RXM0_MACPH|nr:hypothetical protein MPH_03357 [Macrophomina phaseolina MS6]
MIPSKNLASATARLYSTPSLHSISFVWRQAFSSAKPQDAASEGKAPKTPQDAKAQDAKPHRKTQKELDDELKAKMAGISGDGGEAGIEYENGEPVAMKRSVRNNMFRYI